MSYVTQRKVTLGETLPSVTPGPNTSHRKIEYEGEHKITDSSA